jgi:hypothetical protein
MDDDDFNNGNIYEIYKDINDVLYIGTTCNTLKNAYLSLKRIKSKT